jgi:hypothetical protein
MGRKSNEFWAVLYKSRSWVVGAVSIDFTYTKHANGYGSSPSTASHEDVFTVGVKGVSQAGTCRIPNSGEVVVTATPPSAADAAPAYPSGSASSSAPRAQSRQRAAGSLPREAQPGSPRRRSTDRVGHALHPRRAQRADAPRLRRVAERRGRPSARRAERTSAALRRARHACSSHRRLRQSMQ